MSRISYNLSLVASIVATAFLSSFAENSPTPKDLLAGSNRIISSTINEKTSPWGKTTTFKIDGKHKVTLRADFVIKDPSQFTALSLKKPSNTEDIMLNGLPVKAPFDAMVYRTIPGIPISMLKKGTNQLEISWYTDVKTKKNKETARISFLPAQISASDLKTSLIGHKPEELKFQTGPVLGYAAEKFFTLACRVNIPAEIVLDVNNHKYVSKPALLHSFKVEKLSADTPYEYTLTANIGSTASTTIGPYTVKTLPNSDQFKIAFLGDSRTNSKDWNKVASAVAKENPTLAVFAGDMVTNGRNDYEWDEQFCTPGKELLATTPFYGIIGNHEGNCPLFTKLFIMPRDSKNWSQQIGTVLLIGIDGDMNWSNDGELAQWLENILSKSKAKYIFLSSHYPAWTSGAHGRLDKKGLPKERPIMEGQSVIMPLLKKYNATAMLAGHDHIYERSEPTDGVTMIVTGGAGAPLRSKAPNAEKQNPYSKVFVSKLHYCIITVDKDKCTMQAITPEGEVIDTKTWDAR